MVRSSWSPAPVLLRQKISQINQYLVEAPFRAEKINIKI
jgi:hypothetical protein